MAPGPGRLILQDLPKVVEQARTMNLDPVIELMNHGFFTEQPIKGKWERPIGVVTQGTADT